MVRMMSRFGSVPKTRRDFLKVGAATGLAFGTMSGVASCGDGGASNGKRTLHFLSQENDPETVAAVKKIFKSFEKDHPKLTVRGDFLAADAAKKRVTTLLGAGEPPDVASLDVKDVGRMAARGLLEPVTDVVNEQGDVPKNARMVLDGEDYLVPYNIGIFPLLFYRKDWFERAGLSVPKRWSDFLDASKELTNPKKRRFGNVTVSNPETGYTSSVFVADGWANDLHIFNWDGSSWSFAMDSDENQERATQLLEWLSQRYKYSPESTNYAYADVNQAYASGKIGMVAYSGRTLYYTEQQAPKIASVTGVAPEPFNTNPVREKSVGGYCIFKKKGRDAEPAKNLCLNLVTGPGYLDLLWSVPGHLIPPSKSLREGAWRDNKYLKEHPDLLDVIDKTLPTTFPSTIGPYAQNPESVNTKLGEVIDSGILADMTAQTLVKGKSPRQGVAEGTKNIRSLVEQLS